MTSKERLLATINHIKPDKIPIDLGSTAVTGIHAFALNNLRKELKYTDKAVKVYEVLQQLGLVEEEDRSALNVDIVGINPYTNFVGVKNDKWENYIAPGNFNALVAENFNFKVLENGTKVAFPMGDTNASPSMKMPNDGWFYDNLNRSSTTIDDYTDPIDDFKDSFSIMTDDEANYYKEQANYYYNNSDYGVIGNLAAAGFGDVAFLPGASLTHPKGIRSVEEWIMAHKLYPEYIHGVYKMQAEFAIKNLEIYRQAVGEKIQVIFMGGTDFGTQICEFMSKEDFKEFYFPYWKKVNDWVHQNTGWKTFYHSCGSIYNLIDEFIDAGADILNPIQCTANNMSAKELKKKFGDRLTFWGGAADTQTVLAFGNPEQVDELVKERINIFGENGGFVLNQVHNIQANTPIQNIIAYFNAIKKYNS